MSVKTGTFAQRKFKNIFPIISGDKMPCIDSDGKPTPSARKLLESLKSKALPPEEIVKATDMSIPRIRSILRELLNADYVKENEGKYELTEEGIKTLQK